MRLGASKVPFYTRIVQAIFRTRANSIHKKDPKAMFQPPLPQDPKHEANYFFWLNYLGNDHSKQKK